MGNSYKQRVQKQFGSFCVKVLRNEAVNIEKEYAHILENEKLISELSIPELAQLSIVDRYFNSEHIFEVQGLPVVVTGNSLANAIEQLSPKKRDVIILSYFLGMNDREIGELVGVIQQTVFKRRKVALKEMRKYLKKEELNV